MSYSSEDYKNYILDQMHYLDDVSVRRMFGGYGFYLNGKFFAILSGDQLYFKTNKETKTRYEKYSSKPFQPSQKQKLKNYYEVPVEIIEDSDKLKDWSEVAAEVFLP